MNINEIVAMTLGIGMALNSLTEAVPLWLLHTPAIRCNKVLRGLNGQGLSSPVQGWQPTWTTSFRNQVSSGYKRPAM